MKKNKSARHHWWPECVSSHWADADGMVHWVLTTGEVRRIPPAQLGAIGNGHFINLSGMPGGASPWDENFEPEFDRADNEFPSVISWLEGLVKVPLEERSLLGRFSPQSATDGQLAVLAECVISLAVRSPMNRSAAVALAEHYRGNVPNPERNALIGLNIKKSQRVASDATGSRAKFVVIYSPKKEFVFGDGFCSNISGPINGVYSPRILVPVTPEISVLIVRPMSYGTSPKLVSITFEPDEAVALNEVVQVYSKDMVIYRSEAPLLLPDYKLGAHRRYNGYSVVDMLVDSIPGVHSSDAGMRSVAEVLRQRNLGQPRR
jgi:hypothetical protein